MPKGVHSGHLRGTDHPAAQAWAFPIDSGELRRLYEVEAMSQMEIAAHLGVTLKRVQTAMRRYGIQPRPPVKRDQTGERNSTWKGDEAGYQAMHLRVERRRGTPSECAACDRTDPAATYDWANLSGHYDDPTDYVRLCRSCHHRFDNRRRGGDAPCP